VSAQISAAPTAAETLPAFAGRHQGATILVCGCGTSLNEITTKPDCITIGVNDVGRRFDPDYLVVVNPPSQLRPDRLRAITESRACAVFSQYAELRPLYAPLIRFALGSYGGTDFGNPGVLHYTQNSPYVALCLAVQMGAARIGLIGVDFTDDHFFGRTGVHPLTGLLRKIDGEYARLRDACTARGIEVVNLSPVSRLTAFPRVPVAEFLRQAAPREEPVPHAKPPDGLRIVSYATTPIAGVPAILARCIAARTPHQPRCIWATNSYGNGVAFEGDLEWSHRPAEAEAALADADVVIVHNGKIEQRHRKLLDGKPVVTMAHNYLWNVDARFVEQGMPGVVVGQYQATLPEFANWAPVPNPVPLWEPAFSPQPKSDVVTIAYTPSGRHENYPENHRLFWHGKGFETTMRALDALARRHRIELITVRNRQISHAEALAAKRRAHIVIDECVTGSYHRNSLEGLAAGCVVVNGVGLRPAIGEMLRTCAGGGDSPFVFARLDTLEAELEHLVSLGAAALAQRGAGSRSWMEQHWSFATQWGRDWRPAVEAALARRGRPKLRPPIAAAHDTQADRPVSIVIPHGGVDRRELLATTLAAAARDRRVGEIIVAEMDAMPRAHEIARRMGVRYVFIRADAGFNKARAINVGTALAGGELVLWLDNDVLLPAGFLDRAIDEVRRRELDCLIPWTSVHYLSEESSRAVMAGTQDAEQCRPVNAIHTRRGGCGGAVLVRRRLVQEFGGMYEAFRGWGGEDNAWLHKAGVVGRAGVTARGDQHLRHLFHEHSSGYGGQRHIAGNPHYQANVALLYAMRRVTDRVRFMAAYPVAEHSQCPWDRTRTIVCVADPDDGQAQQRVQEACSGLHSRFGVDATPQPPDGDLAADAVVVFGAQTALRVLHSDSLRARSVVVDEVDADVMLALVGPLSVMLGTPAAPGVPAAARSVAGTALVAAASGIGDLIRVTPLIRVLAQLGHRVDFLIAPDYPDCADLFRGAPEVNRVIVRPPLTGRAPPQRIAEIADTDYELAVFTHLAAGDSACCEHIARELGWQAPMPPPFAVASARRFDLAEGTVVLHPGCKPNWPWKRWHGFADLAALLPQIAIVGTEADRTAAGTHQVWPAHAADYIGKLSLPDTAALISQAAALVSNDSGLMHLGVAVATPTFGIFGITNPEREIIPAPHMHALSKGLPCEPDCRRQPWGRRDCAQHIACLKTLDAKEVLASVVRHVPRLAIARAKLPAAPPARVTQPGPMEKLVVAIRMEGGIGDVILQSRLVEALFHALGHCCIDVFYRAPEIARFVFQGSRLVRAMHPLQAPSRTAGNYDVSICTGHYVQFEVRDWDKLRRVCPQAETLLRSAGERFERYRGLFERRPQLDGLWGRMSGREGRNVLDNFGYLTGLTVDRTTLSSLCPNVAAYEEARRLLAAAGPHYVTLHDGFDTSATAAAGQATKCWPLEHWAALVEQLHAARPDVKIVQIGAAKSRPIPDVDLDLLRRTTLDQAAWVLKGAMLHIDTDSGLVHLAHALHTPAVVLFGPTDAAFYAYKDNATIRAGACGECWWSTPDWLSRCPRGLRQPACMAAITPRQVAGTAVRRLAGVDAVRSVLTQAELYDGALLQRDADHLRAIFDRTGLPPVPASQHAREPASGLYLHASKQWEYLFAAAEVRRTADAAGGASLRVLDAGGGRGALAASLASLGHQVAVMDRDYLWEDGGDPDVERRYIQWAAAQGFAVRYGALENLPAATGSYDVVTCISVIQHLRNKALVMGELLRVLRPGGRLVLTFDIAADPGQFEDMLRVEIFSPDRLRDALAPFCGETAPLARADLDRSAAAIQCDGVDGIPRGMTVGGIVLRKLPDDAVAS
jgi:ADP-heptose:LPS heptosyltransferase/SAM-dependent methyltransferase